MTIESPATYAEWFWANSLDAAKARSESYEKSLAPIAQSIVSGLPNISDLPPFISAFLTSIVTPTAPDWDNVLIHFIGEVGAGLAQRILGHEIKDFDYAVNSVMQNTLITPDVANALMLRKKISEELWTARQRAGGLKDVEGAFLYESQKPYPTLPDIITYARYHSDPDNPKELTWSLYDISPSDWDLWDWLSWQKPNTEQVLSLYRRKFWTEADSNAELARLGWHVPDRQAIMDLAYILPNAMLLVQGGLMQGADKDTIIDAISKADIHPDYANVYLDGILTKPATSDLIAYELRRDPQLSNLDIELRKIGIHPNYFPLYKELAYQIPPIADIITMAVREAFTPDIAARFGQYENLPPDFVTWVGKKGIDKEWAARYWAAHWTLPSPQQGFEMLHRGIIDRNDLLLLLRALDIMPFWRDKLIEMAYEPLNRIDVRRMYRLGVLTDRDVTDAYKILGYNDTNAERLTEFVVKDTRQSLSRFTSGNVITAFTKRFIDESQASTLLRNMGIKDTEIPNIISSAVYKREWSWKQERIDAIENLYKKSKYDESRTHNELAALNLPADHITTLIQQWQLKAEAEITATWTAAQTLSFLKKGLISSARASQEFVALGYNTEHINIFLASAAK